MSGWTVIKILRQLEERVDALGMKIVDPMELSMSKYNAEQYSDRVALQPKDDSMPHYSRDALVWLGTLEELRYWLDGVEWARQYDSMLKISDDKKRNKVEADERNRQLMATLKGTRLVQGKHRGVRTEPEAVQDDVPF